MADYPQLVLKSGREKSLRNRHPWVYSGAVKARPKAEEGVIVEVISNNGEILGYGHYAPSSTIISRIFVFGKLESPIDSAFWQHG